MSNVKDGDLKEVEEMLSRGEYQVNCTNSEKRTPLHIACGRGCLELARVLVRHGANFTAKDSYNDTPLTLAAKFSKYDCVLALIKEFDCDIDVRVSTGRTLLHFACSAGNVDLVHVLLKKYNADLSIKDNCDRTPYMTAVSFRQYEVWKVLVCDYGCDPKVRSRDGVTLLHMACANGDIDMVNVLVQEYKADFNVTDDLDQTPLMFAAGQNQCDTVKLLVCDYGCDPNTKNSDGKTLLHIACADGDADLVHVLIRDCKADLNIRDDYDNTPLIIAARNTRYELVKSLVCDYGCDPNVRGYKGESILHIACAADKIDLIHVLLQECMADLDVKDDNNDTPLMIASRYNKYIIWKSLICDYGCDPNIRGYSGKSLLHVACIQGNFDLMHVLVQGCNADLNIRDDNGDTPLMAAAKNSQCKIWKSLVCDYSCDPNIKGYNGESLLHIACADGDIDLVHVLVRDCKADLNVRDDYNYYTPFMTAFQNNQHKIMNALVCDYGYKYNKHLLHLACSNGNINLVQIFVQDYKADLSIRDDHNNTPLMIAVKSNKCALVKLLISEYKCDVSLTDNKGRSLLHKAGGVEVLKLLIEEYKMSPLLTDNDGNTPLHLFSSSYEIYHVSCAHVLMFEFHAPIFILNKEGKTPKDIARMPLIKSLFVDYQAEYGNELQADYRLMQMLAAKRYSGSNFICRLFIVGHPGAGKSSLVETLKREGFFESFTRVSEKLVPPHTAGIVPSIFHSGSYGRVQFYDFAGDPEYYSTHAAILERLFQSSIGTNICILILNMLEDDTKIEEKYLFWLSFINYSFKRLEELSVLVIGSHSDQLPNQKEVSRKNCYIQGLISKHKREGVYLPLDCCNPRSSNIRSLRQNIHELVKKSQPYSLSMKESVLLGLLEKDFGNVTACTVQTITSHIEELNLSLPSSVSLIYPMLQQLQAIGLLLLVGGKEQDCYVVLKVAELTNEVHKKLYAEDAFSINPSLASFNVGLLPESLLQEVLPNYITKECLIQLQYCQEVARIEIDSDYSVSPSLVGPDISTSSDRSYLFFPALCSLDKKKISWQTPPEHSYSIGWLARCRDPHDYFPSRFLHVLLLRIALRFTLIVPSCLEGEANPNHKQLKRRCKMWKTGVHWLSEEEVECEVDVVGSMEIVVSLRSIQESKTCFSVLNSVVSCVMEAKAEFCDFIVLDFFLLDKVSCLTEDNLFSVEDVERVLREGKPSVLSVNGEKLLSSSKLLYIGSSSFWNYLFPIDEYSVLKNIETIVKEWFDLGLNLKLSPPVLKAIEANYPRDVIRCKTEMVITWLSSSLLPHPPCWWSLVKALHETKKIVCAKSIIKDKGEHIALQEKLFKSQDSHLTSNEDFLESFAGVVGSKWPYLASLLSLTSSTIEEVRREGEGLTQRERALLMLHKWVSKEEATYSQLYQKLKPISLLNYSK